MLRSLRAGSRALATSSQLYYGRFHPLAQSNLLLDRHIGPNSKERTEMLKVMGLASLDELIEKTLPASLPRAKLPQWPVQTETQVLEQLEAIVKKNQLRKNYIGCGYYGTHVPLVVLRNVLENPAWYTSYTPYQAEISQGRLEALLNFQTMICSLTALPVSGASLLDEATAAGEALYMCYNVADRHRPHFLVSDKVFPQTIEVVKTRAAHIGVTVHVANIESFDFNSLPLCGVLVQSPDALGEVSDFTELANAVHGAGALLVCASDLLAMTMIKPPGEMGADIALGSAQRFGVPMGYGGPHAAFLATKQEYIRKMPGRIIGVSRDVEGNQAFRMTLMTREQHIRRERATSNICTAQALLANMAGMYAVYHGPEGLKNISTRVHSLTDILKTNAQAMDYQILTKTPFDTVAIGQVASNSLMQAFEQEGMNIRKINETTVALSLDETTTPQDVEAILSVLAKAKGLTREFNAKSDFDSRKIAFPTQLQRSSEILANEVFNSIHSESQMLRYLYRLQRKDISLTNSMISLGSCTMKLNATVEMMPVTWTHVANMHPYCPPGQAKGYEELVGQLKSRLLDITGLDEMSFQPNSGAQGEYTGLLTIVNYLQANGGAKRNVCLIPTSAHGTNPASAAIAGLSVVTVACDSKGNINLKDLEAKASKYSDTLACVMVTYPSTHGVFEETITQLSEIVHKYGGQVYMDGANMNAQVGLTSPGLLGADVCHLNLHKTFAIPHGGGGPGMGPIAVKRHLAPYLPRTWYSDTQNKGGQVTAAHFGSASILPISWVYLMALGATGLQESTKHAILNANYIAARLKGSYNVVYTGTNGFCAHEIIIDIKPLKLTSGITEEDVAKRLMDFGFHSPTMSFPIPGTLMIEPTESEDKGELDRFCEAMLKIRQEISDIEEGRADKLNNPLKRAPHTMDVVMSSRWDRPYTREEAAFPLPWVSVRGKHWPAVSRVDNVWGDKNPQLHCPDSPLYL